VSIEREQARRSGVRELSSAVILTVLLFVLASASVAWVYTGMIAQERWPLRWLEIDGPFERVSAEQVRAVLSPLLKGTFFTIDTQAIYESAAAMPWVSAVTIQKNWPDTIQVRIHEHTPAAHWLDGKLLDTRGQPFAVQYADDIHGLPWLEGPQDQQDIIFENWKKFDDRLVVIGQQIERLKLDARGSWSARLSDGTEIRFGKGDIFKNLDKLVSVWAGLMQGQSLPPLSVDLRYTNGFAVLWPDNTDAIAGNYGEKT